VDSPKWIGLLDSVAAPRNTAVIDLSVLERPGPVKRAFLVAQMAKEDLELGFTIVRNIGHSGLDGELTLLDAMTNARRFRCQPQCSILRKFRDSQPRRRPARRDRQYSHQCECNKGRGRRFIEPDPLQAIVAEAHNAGIRVAERTLGRRPACKPQSTEESIRSSMAISATEQQFRTMRAKGTHLVPALWLAKRTPHWPTSAPPGSTQEHGRRGVFEAIRLRAAAEPREFCGIN
jgi:hypothetical protein